MPLYDISVPGVRSYLARITCVKLDGKVLFQRHAIGEIFDEDNEYIKAADTDEGWVDIYETKVQADGKRHLVMTDWADDPRRPGKKTRTFIIKRLTGKVEVLFGE
jgi:hypothetical protein